MALLWSFLASAVLCMTLAGSQAVRLMHDRDSHILRLQGSIAMLQAEMARTEQQIEAQKLLLAQAEAWMKAQRPDAMAR